MEKSVSLSFPRKASFLYKKGKFSVVGSIPTKRPLSPYTPPLFPSREKAGQSVKKEKPSTCAVYADMVKLVDISDLGSDE